MGDPFEFARQPGRLGQLIARSGAGAIRITFHPLIDEPGGQGPSGRRRYKRADGVNVGLIRVDGEDAYTSEARRYAVNDWTVSLMRSDAEAMSVPTTLGMSPHSGSGSRRKPLGAM